VQIVAGVVQPPSSVLGHGHDVLDPHSEPSRQVDTRFDGEAHPRYKLMGLPLDDVGRFVRGQADSVAGAVDEVLAVAGVTATGFKPSLRVRSTVSSGESGCLVGRETGLTPAWR